MTRTKLSREVVGSVKCWTPGSDAIQEVYVTALRYAKLNLGVVGRATHSRMSLEIFQN